MYFLLIQYIFFVVEHAFDLIPIVWLCAFTNPLLHSQLLLSSWFQFIAMYNNLSSHLEFSTMRYSVMVVYCITTTYAQFALLFVQPGRNDSRHIQGYTQSIPKTVEVKMSITLHMSGTERPFSVFFMILSKHAPLQI